MASGILILIAACLSAQARALFLQYQIVSLTIFVLAALLVLPSRLWLASPILAASAYIALRLAIRAKEQAIGLPITWIDLVSTARNLGIVLRAVGYHGSMTALELALGLLLLLFGIVVAFLAAKASDLKLRIARRAVEILAVIAVSLPALLACGRDLQAHVANRYPDIALDLWFPQGQRVLLHRAGPLEYIAFTYVVGGEDWFAAEERPRQPYPATATRMAAQQFVRHLAPGILPNIAVLHAESTFDPNWVFMLNKAVNLPLWTAGPQTVLLGPLHVNVVGGGTHVTQFELFTGLDTRQFGYFGFYTHQTIAPRVQNAFPAYLARKGYRTVASYPVSADWQNAGTAFRAYGFQKTYYAPDLWLKGDWSESDPELIRRVVSRGVFRPTAGPLFVFLSTLENHGPHPCVHFSDASQLWTTLRGPAPFEQDCSINEYLRRARSTSIAMMSVMAQLKRLEAETGRPFVLLVYGDHQPWSFTDGNYSVAGGLANAGDVKSFARYRRGANQQITVYHLISSVRGVSFARFDRPIPVTLLPTLLSAYVASNLSDLYLPLNFLAFARCGTDYRTASCPQRREIEAWSRRQVLGK